MGWKKLKEAQPSHTVGIPFLCAQPGRTATPPPLPSPHPARHMSFAASPASSPYVLCPSSPLCLAGGPSRVVLSPHDTPSPPSLPITQPPGHRRLP
ncbi:hypothetical protein M0R45_025852 [Rubus argutus]|uniref:Uncharacterized protein n=1 Tax=Rubus argutus TaxID=59490 RepID=A0AAW1WX95_RUBAR